jgi:CheY-like chemotaxis protein
MGRIAIVDDSADILELLELVLRDHHEFRTFSSGVEFVEQFRAGDFDLILLDLLMPELDGFETFRRIRRVDKDVPVAAITASAFPLASERGKALSSGFCDYFIKPVTEVEKFRQTVYSHVRKCAKPPYNRPDKAA